MVSGNPASCNLVRTSSLLRSYQSASESTFPATSLSLKTNLLSRRPETSQIFAAIWAFSCTWA